MRLRKASGNPMNYHMTTGPTVEAHEETLKEQPLTQWTDADSSFSVPHVSLRATEST